MDAQDYNRMDMLGMKQLDGNNGLVEFVDSYKKGNALNLAQIRF